MSQEIKKSALGVMKKNIMGTISFNMKMPSMRKEQDFIVYPLQKGVDWVNIMIQSDTRIGRLNLLSGKGQMSKSHQGGAYGVHLSIDKLEEFELSKEDIEKLKEQIKSTAGSLVGGVVKTDNTEASMTAL